MRSERGRKNNHEDYHLTKRKLAKTIGAGSTFSLAGCLSSMPTEYDDSDEDDTDNNEEDSENTEDNTESPQCANGDVPFSEIRAFSRPGIVMNAPANYTEEISIVGDETSLRDDIEPWSISIHISYPPAGEVGGWELSIGLNTLPNADSVDEIVEANGSIATNPRLTEITEDYPRPDNARIVIDEETGYIAIAFESDTGIIEGIIDHPTTTNCHTSANRVIEEAISTIRADMIR